MSINETHPYHVPNNVRGNRRDTAVLLVGTATEYDINQRDIQTTRDGFRISQALYEALGWDEDDDVESDVEPDAEPEAGTPDYAVWPYPDLKAEVAKRELKTDDQKGETLVAALIADDASDTE